MLPSHLHDGKNKLKCHTLGSLKRALILLKFDLLVIGNKLTYVVNMGWERILHWKIYNNFKLGINYDFLVKSFLGLVHMGSPVPSSKSPKVNMCNLNRWEHGGCDFPLHIRSHVLIPKYGMDAYISTLLEVRLGTCVECWVEQKARPNSQDKSRKYLCIKYSRSDFNALYHILMVS